MNRLFNKIKKVSLKKVFQINVRPFSDFSRNEYLKRLMSEIENTPSQKAQIKYEEPFVIHKNLI